MYVTRDNNKYVVLITQHTEENCLTSYQRDNVALNVGSRTA